MASGRLLGLNAQLLLIVKGQQLDTITDVRSFEMTAELEILKEGYLGESTDRRDDIYRGVSGKLSLHIENEDIFTLMRAVVDRARRREAGTKVNIKAKLDFPNGDNPMILIPDVKFGAIPFTLGGRTEYATVDLSFESEDFSVVG